MVGFEQNDAHLPMLEPCNNRSGKIPKNPKATTFTSACAILGSMTSVISGYDTGVMSGAQIFIQKDLKITDVQLEVLVGTINLYSLLGAAAAGKTSDLIGRKYTIVLAAVIFVIGALMMGLAANYELLMAGRFVAGIGVGYALVSAPVYTTELSPAAARGFLTSFPEVFINLGVLLGYLSNYAFSGLPLRIGWRVMLGIGVFPSILMGIMVIFMPESPRWLMMKGRLAHARRVLHETSSSKEEAESRFVAIKRAAGVPAECTDDVVEMPKRKKGDEVWKEIFLHPTPIVRRILIAGVGIHFFQQASGVDAIVLYSPKIFQHAGLVTQSALLGATVAVGCSKTLSTLIAAFLLDRVGRRPLLLSSVAGMIVSVLLMSFGLFTVYQNPDKEVTWALGLSVSMVLLYVWCFSMGLGPIAWVYSSEIYPLRMRGIGSSLGAGMNRVMSGIVGTTFLSMTKAFTTAGSFFFFGVVCMVAFVFFYTCLPETRGRNLEDMNALFGKSRGTTDQNQEEPSNG